MISTIGVGILSFVSTNLDDLVLLLIFFSSRRFKLRQIVIAQFAGMSAIILASLGSSFVSTLLIPSGWLRFLGLIPILIGIKSGLFNHDKEEGLPARGVALAAIILANGGDNIGVYTPLLATASSLKATTLIVTWLMMTGVWCLIGFLLTKHLKTTKLQVKVVEDKILPLVLIMIGIYVLFQ